MRENTRGRDQTHSYWYIPSAPRVNYSLLIMDSAGMMNMASDDGIPLRQGAGTRSRLVFGGYRGLRRRYSRSRLCSGGFCIYKRFWRREQVRGVSGLSTREGGAPRGWARPPPSWGARGSLGPTPSFLSLLLVQKQSLLNFKSIGLRLVFLFCDTQKQGKKHKLALGSRLIG